MKKERINITMDLELYQALKVLRAEIGISVAESLRRAVREYLAKDAHRAILGANNVEGIGQKGSESN